LTPGLAVKVDARTRGPAAFVKNGEIALKISAHGAAPHDDRGV
jgi:stringent starvation protein B